MKKITLILLMLLCLAAFASCTTKAQKDLMVVNEKYDAGEWQEAIDLADALIEQYPKAEEEISAARDVIEKANLQLNLEAAEKLVEDAKTKYEAGNFDDSITTAIMAVRKFEKAADDIDENEFLADEDNFSRAQNGYDTANVIIGDAYICKAQTEYDAGNYTEAIDISNELLKKYSQSGRADDAKKLIDDSNTAINMQKAAAIIDEIKTLLNKNDYSAVYKKVPEVSKYAPDSEYSRLANDYYNQAKQIEQNSYEKKLKDAYNAGKWKDVQTVAKTIISKYKGTSLASTAQTYSDNAAAKLREEAKQEARSLIRVTKIWISSHDSVGGVNVYFNFVNKSDKTIKRVNFGFTFYDRVGDVAKCEIERDTINDCYYTGPVASGGGLSGTGWCWGKYYNWDIASVKLVSLSIEYMDGTYKSFTKEQIEDVQY
ncbi:MAG: hypothetical protein HFE63_11450 [Clostridiales bacterium]|nr:hypothetical protein [Clostridiales bacterium]